MAQLIVTLPDNQVNFVKKVLKQMGYEASEVPSTRNKAITPVADVKSEAEKAEKIRQILDERKDLDSHTRDVLSDLADAMEGKPMEPWEEGMAQFKKEHEAYWNEQDRIAKGKKTSKAKRPGSAKGTQPKATI